MFAPPCRALASAAPALDGVLREFTRGLLSSGWMAIGFPAASRRLSPSSGSEFWSPATTNSADGVQAAAAALVVVDVAAAARLT